MQCKRTFTKHFTLSTQSEMYPFYGNSYKKCTSLTPIVRYIAMSNITIYLRMFQVGLVFTKKEIALVFNKPTIMCSFFLVRLANITLKKPPSVVELVESNQTRFKSLLVFTDIFTLNSHRDKRSILH